jgi:hypothetical protein
MRDWDLQFLAHFIKRPGIYTRKNNNEGIDNFLIAYELGSERMCTFRHQLSEQVKNNYGIAMPAEGLIEQIKMVAKEINRDWFELFKEESQKLLCVESDGKGKARFASILRESFYQFLKEIPTEIDIAWGINWNQIYRQVKEWTGVNLTNQELRLIEEIRSEIDLFYQTFQKEDYDQTINESMITKLKSLKSLIEEQRAKSDLEH